MRKITIISLMLLISVSLIGCGGSKHEKLIGTWVSPYADNQKLEIRTEELRFNHMRFDYTVDGNALYLEETYPHQTLVGEMPFTLKDDELIIELGDRFRGYFYGCSGEVRLQRQ